MIIKQIRLICKKYATTHYHDCTILIPSKGIINKNLAELVKKYSQNHCEIKSNVLEKLTTNDIFNIAQTPGSSFYNRFRNKNISLEKDDERYQNALDDLCDILDYMDDLAGYENSEYRTHLNKNDVYKNAIKELFKVNPNFKNERDLFNDKDVLVIDDTISRGTSIINAVNIIREYFNPKTIAVLTLFSRKYKK